MDSQKAIEQIRWHAEVIRTRRNACRVLRNEKGHETTMANLAKIEILVVDSLLTSLPLRLLARLCCLV